MIDEPTITARLTLREATAPDHHRVDQAFSAFDLSEATGYRAFLRAQAHALLPVEAALDAAGAERVVPDWPLRRRAGPLLADLTGMGAASDPPEPFPALASPAGMLGAIYVLEGSRLGGRVLARAVDPGFPRAFLEGGDPGRWRTLIEILDKTLISDDEIAAAVGAAGSVFARFEAGARIHARTC